MAASSCRQSFSSHGTVNLLPLFLGALTVSPVNSSNKSPTASFTMVFFPYWGRWTFSPASASIIPYPPVAP